jgi:Plavaka transposase
MDSTSGDDAGSFHSHLNDSLGADELQPAAVSDEAMGRGKRKKRLAPKLRQDVLPDGQAPLPPLRQSPTPEVDETGPRSFLQIRQNLRLVFTDIVHTTVNTFGVSRAYYGRPTCIPDEYMTVGEQAMPLVAGQRHQPRSLRATLWPYPNISAWRLGSWFWGGGDTKSKAGFKDLVKSVLLSPDFNVRELSDIRWDDIDEMLAKDAGNQPYGGEGWKETAITISIPTGVKKKASDARAANSGATSHMMEIPGLWHRSIVALIRSVFCDDPAAQHLHFNPFKQYWEGPGSTKQRVRDELFNSNAWIREHEAIQHGPRDPGDLAPRCIAALMFWSDATHLAQFGQAKLWPIYLYFGNQSKWLRCKPSAHACHHVAYLPGVCATLCSWAGLMY